MAGRERMASMDAAWLQMEEPANLMMITAVLWFERSVDRERLREVVRERLVDRYPRFRQRVVPGALGAPHWEDDGGLRPGRAPVHAALPPPGDAWRWRPWSGTGWACPLERSRPLWQLHLVKGSARGRRAAGAHAPLHGGRHRARAGAAVAHGSGGSSGGIAVEEALVEAPGAASGLGAAAARACARWMRLARGTRTVLSKGVELVQEPILAGTSCARARGARRRWESCCPAVRPPLAAAGTPGDGRSSRRGRRRCRSRR